MFVPSNTNPTAFAIQGVGIVPFSARGLSIEVSKIENGKVVYDVWGVAHSTARAEFDLYDVKVSCEDTWPPGFAALSRGQLLTIQLDNSFIEPVNANGAKGANVPARPATAQGTEWFDARMKPVPVVNGVAAGAVWQRYAPILQVRLIDWSFKAAEWDAATSWSLSFRETR